MNAPLVILFSASLAFVLIEILRWQDYEDFFYNYQPFNRKPLNCIPCLSGWIGLLTAFVCGYGLSSLVFLPICIVAGIALEGSLKNLL
ncbi:MAG: hypothetical protein EOP04_06970 [Proteobacteria bacterium]|nr:MAG: hypothetical protein EOP04_06970 [Pseudomonadota bacterium]